MTDQFSTPTLAQPAYNNAQFETPSQKRSPFIVIGLLMSATLFALGGWFFWQGQNQRFSVTDELSQTSWPAASTMPLADVNQVIDILPAGGSPVAIYGDGSTKPLQLDHQHISALAFDPTSQTVAYAAGELVENDTGYRWIEPNAVYLQELGKPATKILDYPYRSYALSSEFFYRITDVGFSSSKSLVFITTSLGMFQYDRESQQLTEIFMKERTEKGAAGVFSYRQPITSPNDSKVLLIEGYYEGSSQVAVNLLDNSILKLPYISYIGGTKAIGFLDENTVVSISLPGEIIGAKTKLTLSNLNDIENAQESVELPGGANHAFVLGKYAYLQVMEERTTDERNQLGNPVVVFDSRILRYDLQNVQQPPTVIAVLPTDTPSDSNIHGIQPSADGSLIFISRWRRNEGNFIESVLISGENQTPQLLLTGGALDPDLN